MSNRLTLPEVKNDDQVFA